MPHGPFLFGAHDENGDQAATAFEENDLGNQLDAVGGVAVGFAEHGVSGPGDGILRLEMKGDLQNRLPAKRLEQSRRDAHVRIGGFGPAVFKQLWTPVYVRGARKPSAENCNS